MNTNNVISFKAAGNLTGKEYHLVKMTSTGVDLATSVDTVGILGTLLRAMPIQEDGVYLGKAVAVQLTHGSIHYAILGATVAAIASGAGLILDVANPGRLIPSETSPVARSVQACTGAIGAIIEVYFL